MAVTYVGSTVVNEAGATTTGTITISASTLADDDLYLSITSRGHTSGDAYVGVTDNDVGGNTWTRLSEGDTTRKGTLWWKKATSATASKTITITGAITTLAAGVAVYRGGFAGDPTTNLTPEANASGDETSAGFTPLNADSFIVLTIYNNSQAPTPGVTAETCTDPGTLTQRFSNDNAGASGAAATHSSAAQVGGPTATGNITWAQGNQGTKSIAFAIKPAAVAPPGTTSASQWGQGMGATAGRVYPPRTRNDFWVEQGHAVNSDPATDSGEG